jgi:acyl carrier protein
MSETVFMEKLANLLEVEKNAIRRDFALSHDNWDSLTIMAAIALIDEQFGITISGESLIECSSVGDLLQLIQSGCRA